MRIPKVALAVLIVAVLFAGAAPSQAGDVFSQTTFGSNFFSASPPCPIQDIPTFETIAPVPAIFDTDIFDEAEFFCFVDVHKKGKPVKKAKGTFDVDLILIDNITGDIQTFDVTNGKFKTNADGSDSFNFDIPVPIFEDGFESGDVSAWSYTRSDFTNKKKADNVSVQCGKGASRNNN